jgi:autotransporter-associated beta strand protein
MDKNDGYGRIFASQNQNMKIHVIIMRRGFGAWLLGSAAGLFLLAGMVANAQTTWTENNANGSWTNITTVWTPTGSFPNGVDNIIGSVTPGGTRTVTLDGNQLIGNIEFTVNNNRTYVISPGTITPSSFLTLQVSSGAPIVSVAGGATAGFLSITAPLAGNQGLTKSGIGTLVLGGVNTYTGTTTLSLGNLVVNGSLANGSPVIVNNTGTQPGLGGAGTILDAVTLNSGGTISPGNITLVGTAPAPQVGTLTAGSLTWNGGGKLSYQLGDPSLAANSDQLVLNGALTKGTAGTFAFTFTQLTGFSTSGIYTLMTFSSESGFIASDFTGAPAGMQFDMTPTSILLDPTPVPEPATLALLGLGGVAAAWQIRRRQA